MLLETNSGYNNKTNDCKQQHKWLNRLLLDSCKLICFEFKQQQQFCKQQVIKHQMNNNSFQLEQQDQIFSSAQDSLESTSLLAKQHSTNQNLHSNGRQENMTNRAYDVVLFGASGSVGRFLVEELALVVDKYYSVSDEHQIVTSTSAIREHRDPIQFAQKGDSIRRSSVPRRMDEGIKWAIAGRSAAKLSDTLNRAELSTGIKDLSNQVPVILADLNHHKSLLDMCQKSSLIINCAGPYSLTGEVVIKACLESKTNYIDLAHEANFIEQMRQKYSAQALEAKIYIINGCGFHSMSAEMGLGFAKQVVDGQINDVKIIFNISDTKAIIKSSDSNGTSKTSGLITWGMWHSLLLDSAPEKLVHPDRIKSQSKNLTNNKHDQLKRKDTQTLVKDTVKLKTHKALKWFDLLRGFTQNGRRYCLPTSSLTISEESQLISGEMGTYACRAPDLESMAGWRPINCTSFITMKSFIEVMIVSVWLVVFNLLVNYSAFRTIMRIFPSVFSLANVTYHKEDINRESLSHIKFCQTFIAYGTPSDESGDPLERRDKNIKRKQEQLLVARIVGPEPNRIATATYAIQAALTLVTETDHLPLEGGVITPGAAFAETNIIYHLRKRNIKFEVMKKA